MALELTPLPPEQAIRAFLARGNRLDPSFAWQDAWQEDHAAMFTVAKSAGFDILSDIHGGLQQALAEGKTYRDFARELTPLLQKKGWWGKQLVTDPLTGKTVVAQLGSTRRLQTIFDTNMRVSYAAGHWATFERNKKTRPFLRYVHVEEQPHPRWQHHLWHNTVLPVDDPWWNTHACPNGWGCKCTIQSLSQRDVDRLQRQGEKLKFEAPETTYRQWTNKRTGEVMQVPDGIDPGWAYNPGKAGYQAALAGADKLIPAPPALAAVVNDDPKWLTEPLGPEFAQWFDEAAAGRRMNRTTVAVGALDRDVLAALDRRDIQPQSGAITIDQRTVRHILRDAKGPRAVDPAQLRQLPDLIAHPKAVLRDLRDRHHGTLLYVFDAPDGQLGKLVVRLDFSRRMRSVDATRQTIIANAIRTASIADISVLRDTATYELLSGSL